MQIVSVHGLEIYAYHGCLEEEAITGTRFKLDIDVYYDFSLAAADDDLSETVDYVEVSQIAKEEMSVRSKLIEQVAQRIVSRIQKRYPKAEKIRLTLRKYNPPAGAILDHVSVTIEA